MTLPAVYIIFRCRVELLKIIIYPSIQKWYSMPLWKLVAYNKLLWIIFILVHIKCDLVEIILKCLGITPKRMFRENQRTRMSAVFIASSGLWHIPQNNKHSAQNNVLLLERIIYLHIKLLWKQVHQLYLWIKKDSMLSNWNSSERMCVNSIPNYVIILLKPRSSISKEIAHLHI